MPKCTIVKEKDDDLVILGIVGCRNYTNREEFMQHVQKWIDDENDGNLPDIVVSGGAKGADALAKQYAQINRDNNIKYEEFPADWGKYGPAAGPKRNAQIVERCTHILAFPSRQGRGTQDTIRKAKKKGISVTTIYID